MLPKMASLFAALTISYLIGSLPTGYIAAKMLRGIDIREYGSGNIGATNVFRVVGRVPGAAVLLVDIAKGVLAVTLVAGLFHRLSPIVNLNFYRILAGLAAIMGHNWTIFLRFKGGKGIATSFGVLLGICPLAVALVFLIWSGVVLIWRYISLGSIVAAFALPLIVVCLYQRREGFLELVLFAALLSLIAIYKHRPNLRRLLQGQEGKVWKGKRGGG